jgi:hypothetical protein
MNVGATIQSRIDSGRLWHDLTGEFPPDLVLPKLQQYRHIIALNPKRYLCNSSLLEVFVEKKQRHLLGAVLNSTVVALTKQFFARMHGREGSLQLDVYSAQMLPVPDIRRAKKAIVQRILKAFAEMSGRLALPLVDVDGVGDAWSGELAQADRQALDDAVLELLGFTDKRERQAARADLYREMTRLYREIRAAEKKMQKFRAATARQGRLTPHAIAAEIWESFNAPPEAKTLPDFAPPDAAVETVVLPAGKAKVVLDDMFNKNSLQVGGKFIPLRHAERAQFALALAEARAGHGGAVNLPLDPHICARALRDYQDHLAALTELFANAAAGYTSDETLQARVVKELWKRAGKTPAD